VIHNLQNQYDTGTFEKRILTKDYIISVYDGSYDDYKIAKKKDEELEK